MTPETFADFSICLQFLPNGTAPAWNTDCAKFYYAALLIVPDEDGMALMRAVATEFTFRPSPHDILALWRKAKAVTGLQPADVVAEIYRLFDKYGQHGIRRDHVEPGQARYSLGPPPELTAEARAIVAVWGGWVNFCMDESPGGVKRGQMLKVAAMILNNEGDGAIERLRLEYREQVAALPRPEPDPLPALLPLEGGEAGGLTRMGSLKLPARSANGHS